MNPSTSMIDDVRTRLVRAISTSEDRKPKKQRRLLADLLREAFEARKAVSEPSIR